MLNHLKQKGNIVLESLNTKNDVICCSIEESGCNSHSVLQTLNFLQSSTLCTVHRL